MSETDRKYRDMDNHPYVKYLKRKIDIKDDVIRREKKKETDETFLSKLFLGIRKRPFF